MGQEIKERPRCSFREEDHCPTIFRAPFHIRYSRESDFEPRFVSIGPYFHGRENLSAMEARKLHFISDLLEKLPPGERTTIPNFIERFKSLTRRGRACYKESIGLNNDDFVRLLVLDSCFIIRLILSIFEEVNDSAVVLNANLKEVRSDLLLMENQIPLFFLRKVYTYFTERLTIPTFPTILELFICLDLPWQFNQECSCHEANHLLDLYLRCFSLLERTSHSKSTLVGNSSVALLARESWGNCSVVLSDQILERIHSYNDAVKVIPNASELYKRVGVEFRKRPYGDGFGVSFQNGIMSMPWMKIDSNHTTLFVNLVAFEKNIDPKNRVLTSYMVLMGALIDTEKDVRLLQQGGIIHNTLSTNKMAATFFNDIGNICLIDCNDHFFFDLFRNVQKFYHSSYNRRLASLHHNYFDSPWKGMSVVAGTILLILSALQTFYTIFSYYRLHC